MKLNRPNPWIRIPGVQPKAWKVQKPVIQWQRAGLLIGQIVLLVIKSYYTKKTSRTCYPRSSSSSCSLEFQTINVTLLVGFINPSRHTKKTYPIIGISENHRLKVAFWRDMLFPRGYNPPVMLKVYHGLPGKPLEVLSFLGLNFN